MLSNKIKSGQRSFSQLRSFNEVAPNHTCQTTALTNAGTHTPNDILRYIQHRVIHMLLCKELHMSVVKSISDQTHALTTIQEREDHIQRTIAHGYDDLTNDRVRPWKQAKAEADRMRASR